MKKSIFLLLVCSMVAFCVQAQVSYKDSKYGWSVTLPEGWAIQPDSTQNKSKSTSKVTFIYKKQNAEKLSVLISRTPSQYKGNIKGLIELRQQDLANQFKGMNKKVIKAKIKNGKQTISGKDFATSKVTLFIEGDRSGDIVMYILANDEYEIQIFTSYSTHSDAAVPVTLENAVKDIASSLK